VRRPELLIPGAALYDKLIDKAFLESSFTGDFVPLTKQGLSILIMNYVASKKGFLKSIGGDLAPILNGPFG
jgi:hypothetical protein